MPAAPSAKSDLKSLLQRLETRAEDGYASLCFQAKAVGKSKDAVHLAVESGIIAVPLDQIAAIAPIPGRSPVEVSVEVLNGDTIRHLRQVPDTIRYPVPPGTLPEIPMTWPPRVPPGGFPNTGAEDGGSSTSTGDCTGIDTTTTSSGSGGNPDQTDDYRQSCWHDKD